MANSYAQIPGFETAKFQAGHRSPKYNDRAYALSQGVAATGAQPNDQGIEALVGWLRANGYPQASRDRGDLNFGQGQGSEDVIFGWNEPNARHWQYLQGQPATGATGQPATAAPQPYQRTPSAGALSGLSALAAQLQQHAQRRDATQASPFPAPMAGASMSEAPQANAGMPTAEDVVQRALSRLFR